MSSKELLEKFESLVYDRGFIITKKCQRGVLFGFSWIEYEICDYFSSAKVIFTPRDPLRAEIGGFSLEINGEEDLKELLRRLRK